ncbi:head completion protein [Mariniblastus sp.]|nr:head completion protein [Mariniblastus sp.]
MNFKGIYMAYSGKYIVKNRSKYSGDADKVVYRSMWERHCFYWCDVTNSDNIKNWCSEEVVIPYFWDVDKRMHRYFMDLKITFKNGKTILVEIKPDKETRPPKRPDKSKRYINEAMTYVKNRNKWETAEGYAKDRGWEFQIWTEKHLTEMGIMPKQSKKGALKKLKPLKPFRKKKIKK